jgi:hypothetical protein
VQPPGQVGFWLIAEETLSILTAYGRDRSDDLAGRVTAFSHSARAW